MPKVSVIIPCYNQGQFIDEAVNSVLNQTFQDFEIIIINDGSTEDLTKDILKNYNKLKTEVIHIKNQGVSIARNIGIKAAKGQYILPLDADDKIGENYLQEAIRVFEIYPSTKLVYCEADLFGAETGKWEIPTFNYKNLLVDNLIFCTAMFKKSDFLLTTGYNPNMEIGWEDWDFWISFLNDDDIVYKIPKTLFFYRKKPVSRLKSMDLNKKHYGQKTVYFNNYEKYFKYYGSPQSMISKIENLERLNQNLNSQIQSIKLSESYKLAQFLLKVKFFFTRRVSI